jgi:hypothetical protein
MLIRRSPFLPPVVPVIKAIELKFWNQLDGGITTLTLSGTFQNGGIRRQRTARNYFQKRKKNKKPNARHISRQ